MIEEFKKGMFDVFAEYFDPNDWDNYNNRFMKAAWKKRFGTELQNYGELTDWINQETDQTTLNQFMSSCFNFYHKACDIEEIPENLKAFFPPLVASYPITDTKMPSSRQSAREFCQQSFGDVFDQKLKGCFFKLSSRSSKDIHIIRANSMEDLVEAIFNSLRFEDIYTYIFDFGCINLNFYKWLDDCKTTREIRCFIHDRKLLGITKYQYDKEAEYSPEFIANTTRFIEEKLLPASKNWLRNFVADFYEREDGSVQMLEFNPYNLSDPCLYGRHSNIGNPPVIEHDLYDVIKK